MLTDILTRIRQDGPPYRAEDVQVLIAVLQAAREYVRALAACDVDIHPDAIIHIDALARVRDDAHDALLTAVGEVPDATG